MEHMHCLGDCNKQLEGSPLFDDCGQQQDAYSFDCPICGKYSMNSSSVRGQIKEPVHYPSEKFQFLMTGTYKGEDISNHLLLSHFQLIRI